MLHVQVAVGCDNGSVALFDLRERVVFRIVEVPLGRYGSGGGLEVDRFVCPLTVCFVSRILVG